MGLVFFPSVLVIIGLITWSFFEPGVASRIFIAIFIVGLEGYFVWMWRFFGKLNFPSSLIVDLTIHESDLINAYKLHFNYPGATKEASSIVAVVGLSAFAFVPILLWKGNYIEAAIIGLNWFLAGPLSHVLNPFNGLQGMASKGNIVSQQRLDVWDTTWDKIFSYRKRRQSEKNERP